MRVSGRAGGRVSIDLAPADEVGVACRALVYADHIASRDSCNLETARTIRDQYIKHADQAVPGRRSVTVADQFATALGGTTMTSVARFSAD
ncbi:hypothetical protein DID96_26485 [Burkholderia sp. Bp8963]|uniref:type IV toxin-antitoxin system AbiEi family antitoxin n=1 Tax=Burkholderia sp. Bp8963 TaxID=2184547 RepID=UPI000F5AD322|nr:hypothetical protein DID96_26485 [Burkholderia sp. Bp8963]